MTPREIALLVDCPVCAAEVGEICRNPFTGKQFHGPAHLLRLTEAERSIEETRMSTTNEVTE